MMTFGWRVVLSVVLLLLFAVLPFSTTSAQDAAPARCKVGAYVVSIDHLNAQDNSFDSDVYFWSNCADETVQPLHDMDFMNALDANWIYPDETEQKAGVYWTSNKLTGTFIHSWDAPNYPFDRHTLEIVVEDIDPVSDFVYDADTAQSGYDPNLHIDGWKINGFRMVTDEHVYETAFGDPAPDQTSYAYSRLRIQIDIQRTEVSSFIQLTAPVYITFMLALITFILMMVNTDVLDTQMALIAGGIFATVVNLYAAGTSFGSGGLSLIVAIHILVLIYLIIAAAVAVYSQLSEHRGKTHAHIRRVNLWAFGVTLVSFIAINVALIAAAATTR